MKKKQWVTAASLLLLWFIFADAYWWSKERAITKCALDHATEVLKHRVNVTDLDDGIVELKMIFGTACEYAAGAGYYWGSTNGMAYWEVVLLAPVVYRFRFDW